MSHNFTACAIFLNKTIAKQYYQALAAIKPETILILKML